LGNSQPSLWLSCGVHRICGSYPSRAGNDSSVPSDPTRISQPEAESGDDDPFVYRAFRPAKLCLSIAETVLAARHGRHRITPNLERIF